MIAILGYIADAWVIFAYGLLVKTGKTHPLHLANAIGCFPVIFIELTIQAWVPLVLTTFFGIVGWYGLLVKSPKIVS